MGFASPLRRLEGLRDGTALTTRVRDAASRAGLPTAALDVSVWSGKRLGPAIAAAP